MNNKDNCFFDDFISTHYFLRPGYVFVPDHSMVISTVIGSGVSVCIYDKKRKIGGMSHFQFPYMAEKGKTTTIYGNIAVSVLVKIMQEHGSGNKALEAQIFGGAFDFEKDNRDIGRENIKIARKILIQGKIPIASEDTGGKRGRKIVFNTATGEVAVLKVENLRRADWYPYVE